MSDLGDLYRRDQEERAANEGDQEGQEAFERAPMFEPDRGGEPVKLVDCSDEMKG